MMDDKKKPKNEIRQSLISESEIGQSLPALPDRQAGQSDLKVYEAIRTALEDARTRVVVAVNSAMVDVYWEIGRQINEAIGDREEYGKRLLQFLAKKTDGRIWQRLF